MPAPFAALEAQVNSACIAALANATAVIGAASVEGVFDDGYANPLGMAGSAPSFTGVSADLAAVAFGTTLTIGAASYTVRGVEPDGDGISRLVLEEA